MKKTLLCLIIIGAIFGCSDNGDKSGLIAKEVENAREQILAKAEKSIMKFEKETYPLSVFNDEVYELYLENADNLFIFSLNNESNVSMGMTPTLVPPKISNLVMFEPCKKNDNPVEPYGYTFITSLTKDELNTLKDIVDGTKKITDFEYLSDAKMILDVIVSKTTAYPYNIDQIQNSMQLCK